LAFASVFLGLVKPHSPVASLYNLLNLWVDDHPKRSFCKYSHTSSIVKSTIGINTFDFFIVACSPIFKLNLSSLNHFSIDVLRLALSLNLVPMSMYEGLTSFKALSCGLIFKRCVHHLPVPLFCGKK